MVSSIDRLLACVQAGANPSPLVQSRGELKVEIGNVLLEVPIEVLHRFDIGAVINPATEAHALEAGGDNDIATARIYHAGPGIVARLRANDPSEGESGASCLRIAGPRDGRASGEPGTGAG